MKINEINAFFPPRDNPNNHPDLYYSKTCLRRQNFHSMKMEFQTY